VSYAAHCDGPACDTWAASVDMMRGWLVVFEMESDRPLHFCYWDCLLRYGAFKEPITKIEI
jgi:hypothetical protein